MADPIAFDATSPRFALPFLATGQAQKEFFVNQAFSRIDALLHAAVLGTSATPPSAPQPGDCWLVAAAPAGDWEGHEAALAAWDGDQWLFIAPTDGMTVRDGAAGAILRFHDGHWSGPASCPLPAGGTTVDSQIRDAFATVHAALVAAGLIAA